VCLPGTILELFLPQIGSGVQDKEKVKKKQDRELTVAQIMNSLLQNLDLN